MAQRFCSPQAETRRNLGLTAGLALGLCTLAACGGGSSADADAQAFVLESISIAPGELNYQINRPITLRFNRAIDFDTVSPNTVNISVAPGQMVEDPDNPGEFLAVGGLPAIGEYNLVDARTLVFQPACPTQDDLSNSGLLRGVVYTVNIPAQSVNGLALAASGDGEGLNSSFSVTFTTSNSADPAQLFLDTNVDPPAPLVRTVGSTSQTSTRLEVGGDPENLVFFERPVSGGAGMPEGGFVAPLNLYSMQSSRVDVLLAINQPVNPSSQNISNSRIRLEYLLSSGPNVWRNFASDVLLDRNCTATGALLRIVPLGPLPQDRPMRVVIEPEFEDLIGQRNEGALLDVAIFDTSIAFDPGTMVPGDAGDEVLERFDLSGEAQGSLEDVDAAFEVPQAEWGTALPGKLTAAFAFDGTGGPAGTFDVIVDPGVDLVFDTESTQFFGGPNGLPTASQVAIGGVLNVRNLTIPASSSLRIQGSNPCTILASGFVRIEGSIICNGANGRPIFTLNTPNLPEPGAAGVAGGGTGGTGSPLTTQSTPRGGSGFGGINFTANAGGQGGESAYTANTANFGEARRSAGGGGGVLGADTVLFDGCGNETYIGLNVEPGHNGVGTAMGAITDQSPAIGGSPGPGPFTDPFDNNNFLGNLLLNPGAPNQTVIRGELARAWAGAGGGAGGDATQTASYPPQSFIFTRENKGAGGGGGAGSLTILALGEISFGPDGRIEAVGGNGAGGENTNFVNRVGGGSGGGSGGHIVVQSATRIDFSEKAVATPPCGVGTGLNRDLDCLAIAALGGQGGAGAGNLGGWDTSGPDANDSPNDDVPLIDPNLDCFNNNRPATGGDGGPGIIQLHAPTLADIIPPLNGAAANLATVVRPSPIGFNELTSMWQGLMLPSFGRISRAQSDWIPLGAMQVAPGTSTLEAIEFLFDGIDPVTGRVNTTAETVDALPAVLADTLAASGTTPFVDEDLATVVFDVTDLVGANDLYRRNPSLMTLFTLAIDGTEFQITNATSDEVAGTLSLTVAGSEPLAGAMVGDAVEVLPRFFAISTEGVPDFLPDSATVTFRFQAAPADVNNMPDETGATLPVSDISLLSTAPTNTSFRFFRFVVEFDISANGDPLSFSTPLPSVEFMRVPFRF